MGLPSGAVPRDSCNASAQRRYPGSKRGTAILKVNPQGGLHRMAGSKLVRQKLREAQVDSCLSRFPNKALLKSLLSMNELYLPLCICPWAILLLIPPLLVRKSY